MPKYLHKCLQNIFCISQHIKALPLQRIAVLVRWTWYCLGGQTLKKHAFKQPLNHR